MSLLLDGMIIPRLSNKPNQSRRIFRADWDLKIVGIRRNGLVVSSARDTIAPPFFSRFYRIARSKVSHTKRVPIREWRLRAWYYLRRNSNLYEIFLFRKANCTPSPSAHLRLFWRKKNIKFLLPATTTENIIRANLFRKPSDSSILMAINAIDAIFSDQVNPWALFKGSLGTP